MTTQAIEVAGHIIGSVVPATILDAVLAVGANDTMADRGSHQALGILTDVGLSARQLPEQLCR